MKRIYKHLIILIAILSIVGLSLKLFIYVRPYPYAIWWKYVMWSKLKFEFCKYDIPEKYNFIEYYDSGKFPNAIVIWKNTLTGQTIVLFRLRPYLKLSSDDVILSDEAIKKPFKTHTSKLSDTITSRVYVPFFNDVYPQHEKPSIELRGVQEASKPIIIHENKTDIWCLQCQFTEIGLYKPKSGLYKFESYIFDFNDKQRGAFAIITNKATGDAILALSFNSLDKEYDNNEFVELLKSIRFEPEPFSDPFKTFTYRYKFSY